MKKISNKGFVLAETIVVAVFMVTILSALYSNYFPIMANYEKREYYDDLDSKYTAFWLKYMLQDPAYTLCASPDNPSACLGSNGYLFFDCSNITVSSKMKACRRLVIEAGLVDNPYCQGSNPGMCKEDDFYQDPLKPLTAGKKMPLKFVALITPYNLSSLKQKLTITSTDPSRIYEHISDGMIDYINSLPDYNKGSLNGANYRIIIELYDNREREREEMFKYATIEVNR